MNSQWHCKILPIYLSVGIPWIKGSRLLVTECLRIGTAVDRRIFNLQHVSTVKKNNRRGKIVFKKNTTTYLVRWTLCDSLSNRHGHAHE
jgi:hypothetical protein